MRPRPEAGAQSVAPTAADNLQRYRAHQQRHAQQQQEQTQLLAERKRAATAVRTPS
jgi:hypothetical protein